MKQKKILSLFDVTGNWPQPYANAGYEVVCIDLKTGTDVLSIDRGWIEKNGPFHGVMAAIPCTDFAVSGAQYWKAKDADGRTEKSVKLVSRTIDIITWSNPEWWTIENPVGRLKNWLGNPRMYFHPHEFGGWLQPLEQTHPLAPLQDAYTKKTCLWGIFKNPEKRPVDPVRSCAQGSWLQKLGSKSEKTKYARSITPLGFARAFFAANP